MTLVNIDRQPEAVKQFFKSLPLTPEGSVVEMNGKSVARVLPADAIANNSETIEWTAELNERRCNLIDRKYTTGLTAEEESELATLTAAMRRFVDRMAPVPLDDVRKLHRELLEKAAASDSRA